MSAFCPKKLISVNTILSIIAQRGNSVAGSEFYRNVLYADETKPWKINITLTQRMKILYLGVIS